MNKYTPGRWAVLKTNKSSPLPTLHSIVTEDTGDVIVDNSLSEVSSKYDEGNANLIAAAPELLEACEAMLHLADQFRYHEGNPAFAIIKRSDVGLAMIAAVKKARGEE